MFAFARLLSEMCSPIARFMGMGERPGALTYEAEEEERASKPQDDADDGLEHRVAEEGGAESSDGQGQSSTSTVEAMAPLPLGLACAGMGLVSARSGKNSAAFASSKVWEDNMNAYFRTRSLLWTALGQQEADDTILILKALGFGDTVEKAWAQRDVRQTCDTVLIPEVVGLEETGEKAGEQTDVAQTYDTVLIPEGARAETVKKAGEQRDVAQAGDSAVTHETRRGVARRKARKNVRSNVRKETAQDASVTEAQKEPREGEDCGEQDIVRLEPEDFATVLGKEKELLEVAVPVLERLFRQMPDCLFTLANARGVVLETWGNGSIAGLEKGSLVNEYTPAIAGMTTALVTGRPGIARRQGGSGNETLVCVSAPINDEGGTTLACVTVTSRDNHPYLNVIAGEAADNIASQLRLRASLARESALVENAEEGLMAVDASGRIRRANRVARTMCSVSTLPEKAHLSRFFCLGSLLEDIARGEAFSRVRVELYDREQECGSGEYCLMSFVPGEDGGVLLLRCAEEVVSEGKDVASAQTGKSARGRALGESLRMLECELISEALREAEGNVTLAARNLGIARSTLYSRLERHNLHPREFRSLGASSRAKQRTRKNAAASAEREVSEAGTAPRE